MNLRERTGAGAEDLSQQEQRRWLLRITSWRAFCRELTVGWSLGGIRDDHSVRAGWVAVPRKGYLAHRR